MFIILFFRSIAKKIQEYAKYFMGFSNYLKDEIFEVMMITTEHINTNILELIQIKIFYQLTGPRNKCNSL